MIDLREDKVIQAIERDGKIVIINGTLCTKSYCVNEGCDFPSCARVTNETYSNEEEARKIHPDLEIVG